MNVFGPYTSSEWETLLSLKKAIEYERTNQIDSCLKTDIEDYRNIAYKVA